jgi:DNA-binding NarL/FixJ family response regulator
MEAKERPERDQGGQLVSVAVLTEDPSYRVQICALLEQSRSIEVVAEHSGFEYLLPFLETADVLVLALDETGELMTMLAEREDPRPAVLLISDDPASVRLLSRMTSRAWGALSPGSSAEELANAVKSLGQGLLVGEPHLLLPLLNHRPEAADIPVRERLSPRELQILRLMAQGLANKQIAWELQISSNTVKFHTSSIYAKLGAASRAEAVVRGIELGFITV